MTDKKKYKFTLVVEDNPSAGEAGVSVSVNVDPEYDGTEDPTSCLLIATAILNNLREWTENETPIGDTDD